MKLLAVSLQNFRCYQEKTVIPIDQLTAFIGRNDAGKSTILEALDIFFEGGTVKIEPGDANTNGEPANVRIGAIFGGFPEALDLDAGAQTTLAAEHLLNANGQLEIIKIYNCSVITKVSAPKIFARALHPTADGVSGLLQKKNADLKKLVKDADVEANCQQNNNPSMRQALYGAVPDLALAEVEVPLNDAEAKNIWEAIKRNLPIYALFRSDRTSSDQDPEVQSPMKLAIDKALSQINQDLDEISNKVEAMARETADRTLEQMKTAYPDMELATVLKPSFRKPNWSAVFKLDLESDDGIPLNKRGSGVRRLVLLSFFQAEAERLRKEKDLNGNISVPVIYAIEEPETSQHPEHQERIIDALREVAEGGDQVLLTTHVPALAGLLPVDSLRFVDANPDTGMPRARAGSEEVFAEVAQTLGVLPDAAHQETVGVAVAVEGPTDVDALNSMAEVLSNAGEIAPIDQNRVFWTLGGGSTLKDWVERRYLDSLGVPQIYIFDSDKTSAAIPPAQNIIDRVAELNARPNCQAFLTTKRTIENYMDIGAFARLSENKMQIAANVDPDYGDLSKAFTDAIRAGRAAHGHQLNFHPIDKNGDSIPLSKSKKVITSFIIRNMTANEVLGRGNYVDDKGDPKNEILEWLNAINAHI